MPARPVVNWILGQEAKTGWAYFNNFQRLSVSLPRFEHVADSQRPADIAIYFDPLIARDFPAVSRKSIIRVSGPRPLDFVEDGDPGNLRRAFEKVDAVIALSTALQNRVRAFHSNVVLVPNGLDLDFWRPGQLKHDPARPFTAGFAANIAGTKRKTKGFDFAQVVTERAGVPLLVRDKSAAQIPHDRMIEDFYGSVDVLIHPTMAEGTSNVIMEALALGIPVITTPHAGYHAERLTDGTDALIRPMSVAAIEDALLMLKSSEQLRRDIGAGARRFAERHHAIGKVAGEYGRVIDAALGRGLRNMAERAVRRWFYRRAWVAWRYHSG